MTNGPDPGPRVHLGKGEGVLPLSHLRRPRQQRLADIP